MVIKLVFFDMEGTIFRKTFPGSIKNHAPSAWALIAEKLGNAANQDEMEAKEKWNRGEYAGYVEFMEDTLRSYQKHGLTKQMFEEIMGSIDYYPGVRETFAELRKRGRRTAIVSGGFKAQADRAQKDLKIDHSFAACELFWDKKGEILHWNLLPSDYEGKHDFMKLIIKEHGLRPEECAFVADGRNDVPLAKAVGVSIALNGMQELKDATTHSIDQDEGAEDFREIMKYIKNIQ